MQERFWSDLKKYFLFPQDCLAGGMTLESPVGTAQSYRQHRQLPSTPDELQDFSSSFWALSIMAQKVIKETAAVWAHRQGEGRGALEL